MKIFYQLISYLFHPLFIPIGGTLMYFIVTPKYTPLEMQSGNILPIFILTVIIPIICYFILRNLGMVTSVFMPSIQERKYTLYISTSLLLMIVYKVIPNNYSTELFYYFFGLIAAALSSLLLLFFKFKSSIHLMGMGSLWMYLVSLSIHFEINLVIALSALTMATGLVASSRLYLRAHSRTELLIGFLIGTITQLMTLKFWL